MSKTINTLRNVSAELGQVRKMDRQKLARLRALRESADALTDVKQSAPVARAVLDMTAKAAKDIKTTIDLQEKAMAADANIREKGEKLAMEGKTLYRYTSCDRTGETLPGAESVPLSGADGRAAWSVLSGAKGFLIPEQVEMLSERTDGFVGEMKPGEILKLEKVGENNSYAKLIRCGGVKLEGEEDGRYWEVVKAEATREINREFIRQTDVVVNTAAAAPRYPVMSREEAWEIAMKEVESMGMETKAAAKWVTERCDELQCI